ncbi:hypothetical protein, partial [Actinokineospora sp.]|uniref:hypothetical protein n=1 Tax=Actinokineospora sp. TaxID=1872133 RepID=UPI003D6C1CA4
LAVPRYLGARRNALVAEGDNVLQELKTLAWAYYQQYSDWSGIAAGVIPSAFGFTAPGAGCWNYSISVGGVATVIQMSAQSTAAPSRCTPLGGVAASSINLTFSGDGSSSRTQSLP